jgi:Fusaric acid resistance protein-like
MNPGNIVWNWLDARFGLVISAIPILIILTGHVEAGLPMVIGALPAAAIGLLPTRAMRRRVVIIGLLFGSFLMLGSFMAQWVWVAVPGMFLLALGGSLLASKSLFGMVVLNLCVPLAGVGLSYNGLDNSIHVGLLLIIGSVIAYAWSLCFKEYQRPPARAEIALMNSIQARNYGIRLGSTAAIATAIGFALGIEHIGWIVGAGLFVMRPSQDIQEFRSKWRIASVFIGAMAASWLLTLSLPPLMIGVLAGGALVITSATHSSRWYITPAFSTFLVFWILLFSEPTLANIEHRFNERVLETLIGVGLAYLIGVMVPKLAIRRK